MNINEAFGIDTTNGSTIRKALKEELGYKASEVSVRVHNYSMGRAIHFTVRDRDVLYREIKNFAQQCETVHRDASGDILNGGNTYVHIHVDDAVKEAWAGPLVGAITEAFERAEEDGCGIPVAGCDLLAWRDTGGDHLTKQSDSNSWRSRYFTADAYGLTGMAIDAYTTIGDDVFLADEVFDGADAEVEGFAFI